MSTYLYKIRHFCFALLIVVGALSVSCVGVWAAKGDLNAADVVHAKAQVKVTLGKAELVDVQGAVADVLVADSSVIDVSAIQANRLYVVGLSIGDTNIIALDADGNIVKRLDVHVSYDLQAIQSLVDELFPLETVRVRSVHDQILLTGTVSSPEAASKITNVVGHYVSDLQDTDDPLDELISNLLEVRGEQQVQLQVRIIEASRNVIRELGIDTNLNDPDEIAVNTIFGTTPSGDVLSGIDSLSVAGGPGLSLSQPVVGSARILADTGLDGIGDIGVFINALEEEGLANTLAEPNLTAVSGQQAGFLAGGEFPVPSGLDNVGNLVIDYREFGVSLNFIPSVISGERISLQLDTEVSALDFDNSISLAGTVVPGLNVRRADTTVEIASGASLMIAGLLQSNTVKGMAGLPGISKAPVLGDLVKSNSFARDETELIVIVTPYLVEPYVDEDRVEQVPVQRNNPLANAFAANIRRSYSFDEDDADVFAGDNSYGYLLD